MWKQTERKNKIQATLHSVKSCFQFTAFLQHSILFCSNERLWQVAWMGKELKKQNQKTISYFLLTYIILCSKLYDRNFFSPFKLYFCFIIHTVVPHYHFRNYKHIERILEAPLNLCIYVAFLVVTDTLYIINNSNTKGHSAHIKSFCIRGPSFATFSKANFNNSELCSLS